jgi:hypothetical protein
MATTYLFREFLGHETFPTTHRTIKVAYPSVCNHRFRHGYVLLYFCDVSTTTKTASKGGDDVCDSENWRVLLMCDNSHVHEHHKVHCGTGYMYDGSKNLDRSITYGCYRNEIIVWAPWRWSTHPPHYYFCCCGWQSLCSWFTVNRPTSFLHFTVSSTDNCGQSTHCTIPLYLLSFVFVSPVVLIPPPSWNATAVTVWWG